MCHERCLTLRVGSPHNKSWVLSTCPRNEPLRLCVISTRVGDTRGQMVPDNWCHDLADILTKRPGRLHSINVPTMFSFLNIENIEVKDQPVQNLFLYDTLAASSAVLPLSLSLTMS